MKKYENLQHIQENRLKQYEINNLLILGDSYSTFEGYIPSGNRSYYNTIKQTYTDVRSVEQTWWKQFLSNTKGNLVLNESYSGSTICNTGRQGKPCPSTSFVGRFDKLVKDGFFSEHQIDTIIVFGGTNDVWAASPLGKPIYSNWKEIDIYSLFPAFCYLLDSIRKNVPDARVVCVINDDIGIRVIEGMVGVCKDYQVEYVTLNNISKMEGHPTIDGMAQIEKQIRRVFEENNNNV